MANEEHVQILKQGVKVWNKWRKEHPEIEPNLSGADLGEANLYSATLSKANLIEADLYMANLDGANLSGADLSFAGLYLASLHKADLPNANLSYAILGRANLSETDLTQADLRRADLSGANLSQADLSNADLSNADLSDADLSDAYLDNATLTETILRNTTLMNTELRMADLNFARIDGLVFANIDLSEVKGMETVVHYGPSTIGIDTIYKSKGNIPEIFLRGAGIPDTFITFMKSLTGAAIDFYSCFISYSTKDQAFTERLYTDLQAKGVRCWYAQEDLKIGEPFLLGIEQGIRLHDKLLLVLSEHSVVSGWVQHEVLSAMAKEQGKPPWVLFPIRVDNAIMNTSVAWATMIKQSRHIGDFTHWKDHDAYQQAFERLLRDLKAEKA